jgi:hypothetical protein
MLPPTLAAGILTVLFQLALACGAPWGHLAMGGGKYPGVFPVPLRIAAVVSPDNSHECAHLPECYGIDGKHSANYSKVSKRDKIVTNFQAFRLLVLPKYSVASEPVQWFRTQV